MGVEKLKRRAVKTLKLRVVMINSSRKSAFTLVELCVVLGIITVLIGILLPVITKARRAGKAAVCLSNLRSIANAAEVYQAQNRGVLKLDLTTLFPDIVTATTVSRLVICPGVSDYVDIPETGVLTSMQFYGWNSWLVSVASQSPLKPATIRGDSEVILLGDVMKVDTKGFVLNGSDGLQDPFRRDVTLKLGRPTFHGRHVGAGSVLWVDGHASLENVTNVPSTETVDLSNYNGLTQPPQYFNAAHIGYICKSQNDLNSMAAEYYYVAPKSLLSQNSMMALLHQTSSYPVTYAAVPSQW